MSEMPRGLYADLFGDRFPLPWQMSIPERLIVIAILEHLKPAVAIEIGTADGGSLQVLAANAGRVYSLDTDPTTPERLAQFPNVTFRIGEAKDTLPRVLAELHATQTPYPFVLIDGNHATESVRADIQALIALPPLGVTYVLLHDAFNPECRTGIRTAGWETSPYVRWVNVDFLQGIFHAPGTGAPLAGQMWGGFALAILTPTLRTDPLISMANQEPAFQHLLAVQRAAISPDSPPRATRSD